MTGAYFLNSLAAMRSELLRRHRQLMARYARLERSGHPCKDEQGKLIDLNKQLIEFVKAAEGDAPAGATPWVYNRPRYGWTCFHCGETFRTPGEAEHHFGKTPEATPGCRIKAGAEHGLVTEIRRLEDELRKAREELGRYYAEDSDKDREIAGMQADHRQALIREEEKGYARGLADGMAEKASAV